MDNFYEGDLVKIITNCSNCKAGHLYYLEKIDNKLLAKKAFHIADEDGECACQQNWTLVNSEWSQRKEAKLTKEWIKEELKKSEKHWHTTFTTSRNLQNNKTNMIKLSTNQKNNLSPEMATLIKAEFLTPDLYLTSEGQNQLNCFLLEKFKKDFVQLAEDKLKEEKINQ